MLTLTVQKHFKSIKTIPTIFRFSLKDLIDPAAELFNFHSTKMFVSLSLREVSRSRENGSPCTGARETESAWGHIACSTASKKRGRTRGRKRDREEVRREKQGEATSEREGSGGGRGGS